MSTSPKRTIVIVGGGIIGSTTAYFLTRHPSYSPSTHRIVLLEASRIAGGASGKAGGLLALWAYPSQIVPLSYRLHRDLAAEHNGAERWGYRAVGCGEIQLSGRDVRARSSVKSKDSVMDGEDTALNGESRVSLQKRSKESMARLKKVGVPEDLDWVDADSIHGYEEMGDPSTTAQVHPYLFTTSMAALAKDAGAEIREGAKVTEIKYSADGKSVAGVEYEQDGKKETIEATDVVVSAGPWTPRVYKPAPISALRAHSVTIRPTRPVSAYALFTQIQLPAGFGQTDEARRGKKGKSELVSPEIYARQTEIYACGEGDRLVSLPEGTADVEVDEKRCQDVVDYVASVSDELRDGEVTARQACYLPNVTAGSGHPLIGPTKISGLYLCAGHTCWGIQNGPGSGKLMSEFVFDGKARSADVATLDPRRIL